MKPWLLLVAHLCAGLWVSFSPGRPLLAEELRPTPGAKEKALPGGYRKRWAVCIGINQYPLLQPAERRASMQLRYAVKDAEDVAEVLQTRYGFVIQELLLDDRATLKNIRKSLNSLLSRKTISEDDAVLFYFSGHGVTCALPKSGYEGFLVPADARIPVGVSPEEQDLADLRNFALPMTEIREVAKGIPARHSIFLLDCCHSGLANTERNLDKSVRVTEQDPNRSGDVEAVLAANLRLRAERVIFAGTGEESAVESEQWGHGAFTFKILEALRSSGADVNRDGVTTASELFVFLQAGVPRLIASVPDLVGKRQTPQNGWLHGTQGDFLFIELLARSPADELTKARQLEAQIKTCAELKKAKEAYDQLLLRTLCEKFPNECLETQTAISRLEGMLRAWDTLEEARRLEIQATSFQELKQVKEKYMDLILRFPREKFPQEFQAATDELVRVERRIRLLEKFPEARRTASKAVTSRDIETACQSYTDIRTSLSPEKFPREAQEADQAISALKQALNGIQAFHGGDYEKAQTELHAAALRYPGDPQNIGQKQLLHWQKTAQAIQAITQTQFDTAEPLLDDLVKERLDYESKRIALQGKEILKPLQAVVPISSPSSAKPDDTPLLAAHLQELLKFTRENSSFPPLREHVRALLGTLDRSLRQQSLAWLEEAKTHENRGHFRKDQEASRLYENVVRTSVLLHDSDATAEALLGLKRCKDSEAFANSLGQPATFTSTLPELKKWLNQYSPSPLATYWSGLLPGIEILGRALNTQQQATTPETWRGIQKELQRLSGEWGNSDPMVTQRFLPILRGAQETLAKGLLACQAIEGLPLDPENAPEPRIDRILETYPADLTRTVLIPPLENLRKKIIDQGQGMEYGESLEDAIKARAIYQLMPRKRAFEPPEVLPRFVDAARQADDRVTRAIQLVRNPPVDIEKKALDLYGPSAPRWLSKVMDVIFIATADEVKKLKQETATVIQACVLEDAAEPLQKLAAFRRKLIHFITSDTELQDLKGQLLASVRQEVELAYRYRLYRDFRQEYPEEYLFRSDHDGLEIPMVLVQGKSDFLIDKYEVPIRHFRSFWQEERDGHPGFKKWDALLKEMTLSLEPVDRPGLKFPDDWPAVFVAYVDAEAFARWTNARLVQAVPQKVFPRRLPTESEWMSAAYGQPGAADRPEAMRLYPWGESWEPGRCNITGTDTTGTPLDPWPLLVPHALFDGAKGDRSAWGAVGMGGNASEWATWKPGAPKQVILGGSFIDQNAQATRIGNLSRPPTPIGTRSNNVGFRCVFEFPPNLLATQK